MTATTSLRERLQKIRHNLLIARQHEGPIGLRGACDSAREELELILSALSTPPAGEWVLVPREPTPEMREAGRAAHHEAEQAVEAGGEGFTRFGLRATRAAHVYAAMLAAAPEPATQEVG